MSPKVKHKVLPLAVAQLIAAGAFSGLTATPALAQMGATPIERITVTGTNIRRADAETPSEVQVITKEQMIQQGFTSVSEVLRNLTANSNGTLSTGFARAFASGASGSFAARSDGRLDAGADRRLPYGRLSAGRRRAAPVRRHQQHSLRRDRPDRSPARRRIRDLRIRRHRRRGQRHPEEGFQGHLRHGAPAAPRPRAAARRGMPSSCRASAT